MVLVTSYEEVISGLLEATHRVHPERIVPLLAERLPYLGFQDVALYLADLEQRLLVAVPGEALPERQPLRIDGSLAGQAFRTETTVDGESAESSEAGAIRLWVPLIDGAERLGVLAVTVVPDGRTRRRAGDLATIAAAMVVGKQGYGDGLVLARRRRQIDVAAELRWESLPPLTYANDRVEISGLLEPAYEIAGDAFDYALNGDLAHVAIFDAMGHGLEASRMANLAVASYRNARRCGATPDDTFGFVDETVRSAFGPERFVTGQLATLDTRSGHLSLINAGHPPPVLLRGFAPLDVAIRPCLPFGLGGVPSFRAEMTLQPADVVLFFTDGVTEARSIDGELFGRERLIQLLVGTIVDGPLAETTRRLCHAVLDHQHGRLQDDATFLLVTWKHGTPG